MKIEIGNLWDSIDDVILVTTNATIKNNGEVVMGRGAAREAKDKFPTLAKLAGDYISKYWGSGKDYGLIIFKPKQIDDNLNKYFGLFQVKYNWWEDADLPLINHSTNCLLNAMNNEFKGLACSMNFPGIGNGRLNYDDVLKVVSKLPDSVTLYMKG